MRDFEIIKHLVGKEIQEEELAYVDCYVQPKLGIFIPFGSGCKYAKRKNHSHPSYMIVIYFSETPDNRNIGFTVKENEYLATITSPEVIHTEDMENPYYYCIMIDKEYFEHAFLQYGQEISHWEERPFTMCKDILKTLNTFVFEYSKNMQNADITLQAQATIITHWIVRSMLGENYDMRAISSNYAVARVQHFIEAHFMETITAAQLANLGNISVSSLNRIFKKETHLTPIEYVIEIRIQHAKKLLKRKEIPITQVALQCGFNSSSHLAASFQRLMNMTPSAYRKLYS